MNYLALYKEVKSDFDASNKKHADALVSRWFYRPVGFLFTPAFIKAGLSGNQVSLVGLLIGWTANILFIFGGGFLFFGAILYVLFAVVDFCDGNVARYRKESTNNGRLVDYFVGASVSSFTPLFVAIGVSQNNALLLGLFAEQYIVVGALASLVNMLAKNGNANYNLEKAKINKNNEPSPSEKRIQKRISFNDLIAGTTHITLLLLVVLGLAEIFVYLVLAMAAASLFGFVKKLVTKGPQELGVPKP